jgi:hypothetical protein
MTLSIATLSIECQYPVCRISFIFMLNVVMLSVAMLNVVMLNAVAPWSLPEGSPLWATH